MEKHSTPLAEATTPSLEALKAYSTGMKVNRSTGNAAAISFFRRAVEIDPKFATAYAHLGLSYSVVGESVLSAQCTTRAWQLRDRVTDRERFFVDFIYDRQVTGNLEKAYQTLELWSQTYPRRQETDPQDLLAGLSAVGTGRFERAIEASQKGIAADPSLVFGYYNLASSNYFLDRFEEAETAIQRASERKLDDLYLLTIRYNIAMLKGDKDQMDRIVALANGKHGAGHTVAHAEALGLARSGRPAVIGPGHGSSPARGGTRGGSELPGRTCGVGSRLRECWRREKERHSGARTFKGTGCRIRRRDCPGSFGRLFSIRGARRRFRKSFPEDTFVKFTYAPVLRALAALGRGKPAHSVEQLQITLPYELAVNGLNFNHFYLGGLHSAYVRGEAFVVARQYAAAAAEFQKILDHRGIVGADPIGALAHLQLGRTFFMSWARCSI
jgi:tetratricopeptide (TPR) repeat protein